MKSFLKPDEPVVHIAVIEKKGDIMWNGVQTGNDGMSDHWNRTEGQVLSLVTYTNAEEVELILNGKSLGTQSNNIADPKVRNQIRWNNVVFEPGYIEAVARTAGKVVARHRIETTGKPAALVAQADNDRWQADGVDLQHIDVRIVDDKGRIIQTIDDEVTFEVEGDARIVGVINGYIASNEMTVGNKRRLFNGHCTVILRAGRKPGKVTLSATVDGLKTTKVKLQTL
jgi:beta-galactosidase